MKIHVTKSSLLKNYGGGGVGGWGENFKLSKNKYTSLKLVYKVVWEKVLEIGFSKIKSEGGGGGKEGGGGIKKISVMKI